MEIITIIFIVVTIFLSLWVLYKLLGYGGLTGRALNKIGYGTVIIGISQIVEEINLLKLQISEDNTRMIHNILFIIGLCIVSWGFKNLMDKRKRDDIVAKSGIKTM